MKKILSVLLACIMVLTILSACTSNAEPKQSGPSTPTPDSTTSDSSADEGEDKASEENAEIIDGKFVEKRTITVEVFDRSNDGGSTPDDNFYTDFIKEGMLRDHNVEVIFKTVPRWTEV